MWSGAYAIYNGKEYEFDRDNGQYFIGSRDSQDLKNGFYKEYENYYRRDIQQNELDCIYTVVPVCKYKGYDFTILLEKEDKILISTSENIEMDKVVTLGLSGRTGEYTKWVDKSEISNIGEEKRFKFVNDRKCSPLNKDCFREKVADTLEPLVLAGKPLRSLEKKYKKVYDGRGFDALPITR